MTARDCFGCGVELARGTGQIAAGISAPGHEMIVWLCKQCVTVEARRRQLVVVSGVLARLGVPDVETVVPLPVWALTGDTVADLTYFVEHYTPEP